MTNELTVRVEHPELPAIRWNEAEVQQNLTEMLDRLKDTEVRV